MTISGEIEAMQTTTCLDDLAWAALKSRPSFPLSIHVEAILSSLKYKNSYVQDTQEEKDSRIKRLIFIAIFLILIFN